MGRSGKCLDKQKPLVTLAKATANGISHVIVFSTGIQLIRKLTGKNIREPISTLL